MSRSLFAHLGSGARRARSAAVARGKFKSRDKFKILAKFKIRVKNNRIKPPKYKLTDPTEEPSGGFLVVSQTPLKEDGKSHLLILKKIDR